MSAPTIAREDVKQFKTLGLLGDVFRLAMKLKGEGAKILPLHLGDPPKFDFPSLPSIKEAMVKALDDPASFGYGNPQGYPPLLEKIAEIEEVDKDYVFCGNGVSDMMDKMLNAVAVQGSNILLPAPVFPPYQDLNTKNRTESRLYRCDPKTWLPLVSDMESRIDDHTTMILINSPNNPTGAVYPEEILRQIIDLAEDVNRKRRERMIPPLCLIFDEIYQEHFFEKRPPNVKKLVKDRDVSWIMFNGASKSLNMTGLRMGYAIVGGVQREELRRVMYNECILPLCMNMVFQAGYLAALNDPDREKYLEENRKKLKQRRDLMLEAFEKIPGVTVVKPEGAFYMIIRMDTEFETDRELALALLSEEKLCTSQMSAFFNDETQPEGTYLRLVILPPEKILNDAMNRFDRFMKKHGK